MLLPMAVSAQVTRPSGITVVGTASAEGPAHTVRVSMNVRGIENIEDELLSAMRSAGVTDGAYTANQFGQVGAGVPRTLRGTVRDATRERLAAVDRATQSFAATHRGVTFDLVQYFGDSGDCPAIEARARLAAFDDAKRRAGAIATLSGVGVGAATSVSESGGCPALGQPVGFAPNGFPNSAFPIDPQTLMMRVNMTESITFELVKKT